MSYLKETIDEFLHRTSLPLSYPKLGLSLTPKLNPETTEEPVSMDLKTRRQKNRHFTLIVIIHRMTPQNTLIFLQYLNIADCVVVPESLALHTIGGSNSSRMTSLNF